MGTRAHIHTHWYVRAILPLLLCNRQPVARVSYRGSIASASFSALDPVGKACEDDEELGGGNNE